MFALFLINWRIYLFLDWLLKMVCKDYFDYMDFTTSSYRLFSFHSFILSFLDSSADCVVSAWAPSPWYSFPGEIQCRAFQWSAAQFSKIQCSHIKCSGGHCSGAYCSQVMSLQRRKYQKKWKYVSEADCQTWGSQIA